MALAPYGTWHSHINGDYLASRSKRLAEPCWVGDTLYWLEGRPEEKGRQAIVSKGADGHTHTILPAPWNARSKVHEYGGGSYCVTKENLYFVNAEDQQIYILKLPSGEIQKLSNHPGQRYADLRISPSATHLYAVCEDHSDSEREPKNRIVRFSLTEPRPTKEQILDENHDFVANPRISPCGHYLVYVSWDHPSMPWDASQLWLRCLSSDQSVGPAVQIAGAQQKNNNVSVAQPQWSPSGDLFWVSDEQNWWNLRSLSAEQIAQVGQQEKAIPATTVHSMEAEFATPQWVFGMSCYGFLDDQTVLAAYTVNGSWSLALLIRNDNEWQWSPVPSPLNAIDCVFAGNGKAAFVGASTTQPSAIWTYQDQRLSTQTDAEVDLLSSDVSVAQSFQFPTGDPAVPYAHGFYYPPTNSHYRGEDGSSPPTIVIGHGGPTGSASPSFSYKIQYWTHRGFAILDINYRGSTGYGRQYRDALKNQWGVADVHDLCNAATYAVQQGWANPQQLIIRGSSAGGYSVLAALTDSERFNAGVSLYGIGDLELLATDTHKFEARYLDSLVGPYPETKATYIERSPIHKVDQIQCPLLVFQGLEDKVVPPNQADTMVNAVKNNGLPVAYVTYPEEGHGFRNSQNICHQVEAEYFFYSQIFAFPLGSLNSEPCKIENWPPTDSSI